MPVILVTNDDGVTSPGIRTLADALKALGEVTVVAPTQEASAIGHALTCGGPCGSRPTNLASTASTAHPPIASTWA